jgi:hypothetical protein
MLSYSLKTSSPAFALISSNGTSTIDWYRLLTLTGKGRNTMPPRETNVYPYIIPICPLISVGWKRAALTDTLPKRRTKRDGGSITHVTQRGPGEGALVFPSLSPLDIIRSQRNRSRTWSYAYACMTTHIHAAKKFYSPCSTWG